MTEETVPQNVPLDAPADDALKEHEPAPDHPRFKEIYGKMREGERQLASLQEQITSKDETFNTIIEHNQELQKTLDSIHGKLSDKERPDPIDEPEAYDTWMMEKIERKQRTVAAPTSPPTQTPTQPLTQDRLNIQEDIMRSVYDDYDTMVTTVQDDIKADPILRNEIFTSPNPAKKAYEYAKEKAGRTAGERNALDSQASLEGGTTSPDAARQITLTPEQEKAAKAMEMFGVKREDYIKQLKHIQGGA